MVRKDLNIKEFVKYLDQTVQMFEKRVPARDFEDPNSDVHKLITDLITVYNKTNKKRGYNHEDSNKSDNREIRKNRSSRLAWENNRIYNESENDILDKFRTKMDKSIISTEGPYILRENDNKTRRNRIYEDKDATEDIDIRIEKLKKMIYQS